MNKLLTVLRRMNLMSSKYKCVPMKRDYRVPVFKELSNGKGRLILCTEYHTSTSRDVKVIKSKILVAIIHHLIIIRSFVEFI